MRHAAHREIDLFEITNFERRIVKDVKVFRAKSIRLIANGRQSSRNFPVSVRDHANRGRRTQLALRIHQQRCVIPERMIGVHFIRAHGQLVSINAI